MDANTDERESSDTVSLPDITVTATCDTPAGLNGPQGGMRAANVKNFLSNTSLAAGLFSAATFCTGNIPAAGIFGAILFGVKSLKNSMYSDTPSNDTIKEAINAALNVPGPVGMVKDEAVNQAVDAHIDHVGAPKM